MAELQPLHRNALPRALDKALRYRLLNQPAEAESICLDVLEIEPEHQEALVTLVLALTDQFARHRRGILEETRAAIARLTDEYERLYYTGIMYERRAKAVFRRGSPGCGPTSYDGIMRAMEQFEAAAEMAPPDNEDAILRWNACVRFLERHPEVAAAPVERFRPLLE